MKVASKIAGAGVERLLCCGNPLGAGVVRQID